MNSSILILFKNLQQTLGRRTPPSILKENLTIYRYLMHGKDIKDSRALYYVNLSRSDYHFGNSGDWYFCINLAFHGSPSQYFNENNTFIIYLLCETYRQYMFEFVFYLLSKKPGYAIAPLNRYI